MEQRGLVEKGRVTWDAMYLILSLSTRTLIQVLSMVQRRVVPISDVKLFRYLWCDLMAAGEATVFTGLCIALFSPRGVAVGPLVTALLFNRTWPLPFTSDMNDFCLCYKTQTTVERTEYYSQKAP